VLDGVYRSSASLPAMNVVGASILGLLEECRVMNVQIAKSVQVVSTSN
jgi:hypothetical protein